MRGLLNRRRRSLCFIVIGLTFLIYYIWYQPHFDNVMGHHTHNTTISKVKGNSADSVHSHTTTRLKEKRLESVTENLHNMRPKEKENTPAPVNSSDQINAKLRPMGLESVNLHEFKSIYIREPRIYSRDLTRKAPGKRTKKIITCFTCPPWYLRNDYTVSKHRDFKVCPYNECYFDSAGKMFKNATLVLFFPSQYPAKKPPKPRGQIWMNAMWEPTSYYTIRSKEDYESFKPAFNWTVGYSKDDDLFWPANLLAWRARETLLSDEEYIRLAKVKTKTAVWWSSRCGVQSNRDAYVKEMQKYVDVDVYGKCGNLTCKGWDACASMLNDTYKFYLAFENSFCKDYVTEKFFRSFEGRRFIMPVVRGALEYEHYFPPKTFINVNSFKNAKELALYLKDLANDIPRYAMFLKEKDKLTTLDYKNDWCDLCEMLHTNVKQKTIPDIHKLKYAEDICWTKDDVL